MLPPTAFPLCKPATIMLILGSSKNTWNNGRKIKNSAMQKEPSLMLNDSIPNSF